MTDTSTQMSKTSLTLHWLVALGMIALLGIGIFMAETEAYGLYPIHKSVGVLILLIVIPRIFNRLRNGWPPAAAEYKPSEKLLSSIVHYLLIIGTLLMPVSGAMMSALGGYGIDVFGLELVAQNFNPSSPEEFMPINADIASLASQVHSLTGYVLVAAIILHIAGAFKHHFVDKDGTLKRMLGKNLEEN